MSDENVGSEVAAIEPVANSEAGEATGTEVAAVAVTRPRNDTRAFLKAWEASASKSEVAEKLGISEASVDARASTIRSSGVPLKQFTRKGSEKVNTDALAILAEIRGVTVEVLVAEQVARNAAKAAAKAKREAAKALTAPATQPVA